MRETWLECTPEWSLIASSPNTMTQVGVRTSLKQIYRVSLHFDLLCLCLPKSTWGCALCVEENLIAHLLEDHYNKGLRIKLKSRRYSLERALPNVNQMIQNLIKSSTTKKNKVWTIFGATFVLGLPLPTPCDTATNKKRKIPPRLSRDPTPDGAPSP